MKKNFILVIISILFFSFIISGTSFGITVTAQSIIIPYAVVSEKWWCGLAIHNESDETTSYYVGFYDDYGTELNGKCITVAPHGLYRNVLQAFANTPSEIEGAVSVYIRTTGAMDGSDKPFSATFFMGNTAESQGFGFESYRSQSIATYPVFCFE